ncbi:hypothetical protein BV902_13115 [Sphingobacterium sp. B29]|uniref:metallophosphoesterase family protein n=1 Tax=Sphingobacterium sp. B29 TaxID=1933220 RepID=UPI0009580194|nr:metallophosphoesterase [Sphingobacterium sp. B29]APU97171.1 hypothetical protein BV902_13115 [Sphingobacterium sp. B29]
MRIAIISDLHCKHSGSENGTKSTLLYTDDVTGSPLMNPIKALQKLIKDKQIKCDIILCPGDIADKADRQGLATGWQYLEKIQSAMNAKLLIATVGNHDVNIMCKDEEDPIGVLKEFEQDYPIPEYLELHNQFWQNDFCIVQKDNILILVFNSCHSHRNKGSSRSSNVTKDQLRKIEEELKGINLKSFDYKIALCHHHPLNHGNLDNPDSDLISNGDDLVKTLEFFDFQVVIHGHKHEPKLTYRNSIAVFCSGSLSSTQNVFDLRIDNTFHIMEVMPNQPKGKIESWVLIPKKGWIQKTGTYFPCFTGFGAQIDMRTLAQNCVTWLQSKESYLLHFDDLKRDFPQLDFLTPSEQILFNKYLEELNAELAPSFPDTPKIIGLKISKND